MTHKPVPAAAPAPIPLSNGWIHDGDCALNPATGERVPYPTAESAARSRVCPYCQREEGQPHHTDCHVRRRGKSVLGRYGCDAADTDALIARLEEFARDCAILRVEPRLSTKDLQDVLAALRAAQERIAELSKFFDKYALGPKSKPSCLCCGRSDYSQVAVLHMELPGIVICDKCKTAEAALAAEKARGGALEQDARRYRWLRDMWPNALIAWVEDDIPRYTDDDPDEPRKMPETLDSLIDAALADEESPS